MTDIAERLHVIREWLAEAAAEIARLTVRVNDQNADYRKLEDANASCLRISTELRFDNERLRYENQLLLDRCHELEAVIEARRALEPKP